MMSRVIQFHPEMAIKYENETVREWITRFRKTTGYDPRPNDMAMSPFYHVRTDKCLSLDRFRWCVQNFGLDGFYESLDLNSWGEVATKLWVFSQDFDAVQFKLRWLDHEEVAIAYTAP